MESLKYYCMFIGYPSSGHSVVGAFIDAHRNAIVSHELNAAQRIWSNPANQRFKNLPGVEAFFEFNNQL